MFKEKRIADMFAQRLDGWHADVDKTLDPRDGKKDA